METEFSGLVLHGEVINRHIKKTEGEKSKQYVTYTLRDKGGKEYFVKEWDPDKDNCHKKGANVNLNIYINTYMSKNGTPKFEYIIPNDNSPFGEEF